jgi:hypothetical protein
MTRAAGIPLESHVPIGTRDPQYLIMAVDDAVVTLRPAKGFLTRRSYRVDVGSEDGIRAPVDARFRLMERCCEMRH